MQVQFLPMELVSENGVVSMKIPACPRLMCFFNRGITEETNSLKILCLMFVYFLFYVGLFQD